MGKRRRSRLAGILGGLVLSLACGTPGADAEDPVATAAAAIDARDVRAHVRFLADDLLEGRQAGTRGHRLAALYVAARFEGLGLEPAGDDGTFFATVPLRRSVVEPGGTELVFQSPAGRRTLPLGQEWIAVAGFDAERTEVEAETVFVGYGLAAPELGHDDYAQVDVQGKVVVVLWGAPPEMASDAAAHHAGRKALVAAERGAVGMLDLTTPRLEAIAPWQVLVRIAGRPSMAWLGPEGRPYGRDATLLGAGRLSPAASRQLLAEADLDLDELLRSGPGEPVPLPVRARMRTTSRLEDVEGRNVVARLAGELDAPSEEHVVLTAHLDHDGIGVPRDGDAIYNGAIDNASGVAALLEVAEAFVSLQPGPARSVLFVATDAEEKGLLGAEYFVRHPPVPAASIVANVNMDGNHMLFPTRDIVVLGAEHSTLGAVAGDAAQGAGLELGPDPMPEQGFFTRSDHYPFVKQGIPAVFLIGGFRSSDPDIDGEAIARDWLGSVYHTPADDLSQELHWESGARYAEVAFRIAAAVANAPQRPTWHEDSYFGEIFGVDSAGSEPRLP